MYKKEKYDKDQLDILLKGRDTDNKDFGNIDDLDPDIFNDNQMRHISLGRGKKNKYGNKMYETEEYNEDQLDILLKGRDTDYKEYGNIDDLDPDIFTADEMRYISFR